MKNVIIAVLLSALAGLQTARAGENPRAEREFARRFNGAENVQWSQLKDGYLCASFTLNGVRAESYFDQYAQFIGTARNLFFNQLPIAVMQEVNKRYTGAQVIGVVEISNALGVSYKMVLEKTNHKLIVRMDSWGSLITEQKERIGK